MNVDIFARPVKFHIQGSYTTGKNLSVGIGCIIKGEDNHFGDNVTIGPYCVIENVLIGDNTEILPFSYLSNTKIGDHCVIGPYGRTRDDVTIGDNVVIGNFVEIKKSYIGDGTHAKHLTYIGDANIGKNVNFGCGTVTCNYDGKNKNLTTIKDGAFIGSGTMLIAPVVIGENAMTAAGSAINADVPDGNLAIARAQQVNKATSKNKFIYELSLKVPANREDAARLLSIIGPMLFTNSVKTNSLYLLLLDDDKIETVFSRTSTPWKFWFKNLEDAKKAEASYNGWFSNVNVL